MKLIAKASGDSDRPLPAAGIQHGVLYSIIVLGTQETEYIKGQIKKQFKFNVAWELPYLPKLEYQDDAGQKIMRPQCVFKTYTRSLYAKSNLAQDLVGWRGKNFTKEEENGFDVFAMLKINANALLQITHYEGKDGKIKAKYTGISPLMAGMEATLPENPLVEYEPSMLDDFPEGMPDWAMEQVKKSPEYQRAAKGLPPATSGTTTATEGIDGYDGSQETPADDEDPRDSTPTDDDVSSYPS